MTVFMKRFLLLSLYLQRIETQKNDSANPFTSKEVAKIEPYSWNQIDSSDSLVRMRNCFASLSITIFFIDSFDKKQEFAY